MRKEKEFSRLRDELSRQRRALPREKVEKNYVFRRARGKETLSDLFGGRSQLVVYHFMFGPGWKEGCPSCSFLADAFRRRRGSPGAPRCDLPGNFAGDAGRDRGLQETHGMAVQVGVVVWERLQLMTITCRLSKDEQARGRCYYNYETTNFLREEAAGHECVLQE